MVSAFASLGIRKLQELLLLCSRLQLMRMLFAPCGRKCWRVFVGCFVLVLRLQCRNGRRVRVVAVCLLQHVVIELKEEEVSERDKGIMQTGWVEAAHLLLSVCQLVACEGHQLWKRWPAVWIEGPALTHHPVPAGEGKSEHSCTDPCQTGQTGQFRVIKQIYMFLD